MEINELLLNTEGIKQIIRLAEQSEIMPYLTACVQFKM